MDPFTNFLVGWVAAKMLDKGINVFSTRMGTELLASLESSPVSHNWENDQLTSDQRHLLKLIGKTRPSRIKRYVSKITPAKQRPILLLGPSGTGKTCVGMRVAGITPEKVRTTRNEPDITKFAVELRAVNVYAPPGARNHGDYLDTATKLITSKNPPSVVVMVICGGYHATADPAYTGTLDSPNFKRPDSRGSVAQDITAFRTQCMEEEVNYMEDMISRISDEMKQSVPWVITVVNKKDLWWDAKVKTLKRYESETSEYGSTLARFRGINGLGAPDKTSANHIVYPAYLSDDGFGPDPTIKRTAFRQAHMEADAMVLRALVFNKYSRGY